MKLGSVNIPKILVIDDDDQVRRLLLEILNGSYDCREAGSAEAALLILAQENFDPCSARTNQSLKSRGQTVERSNCHQRLVK